MMVEERAVRTPDCQPVIISEIFFVVVIISPPVDASLSCPLKHLFSNFEILVQSMVEFSGKPVPQEGKDAACIKKQDNLECPCIPERQSDTDTVRSPPLPHGSLSCKVKPTPRTVWMSF